MIPLYDDIPARRTVFLSYILIALNVLVFLMTRSDIGYYAVNYGVIPARVWAEGSFLSANFITYAFLHGSWWHLAGNMLYMWIFANNVEDALGYIKFIIFYFLSAYIAALAHVLLFPSSTAPLIGASGAISGILAAYMVLFPYAGINTLLFLGFFITITKIPAFVFILFWFFGQVMGFFGSSGHIAWDAHIAGFIGGLFLLKIMVKDYHKFQMRE